MISNKIPLKPVAIFAMNTSIKAFTLFLMSAAIGIDSNSLPDLLIDCLNAPLLTFRRRAEESTGIINTAIEPNNILNGRNKRDVLSPNNLIILPEKKSWNNKENMLKFDSQKPKNAVNSSSFLIFCDTIMLN